MMTGVVLLLVCQANPYLTQGREHFEALDYAKALRALEVAVTVKGQRDDELLEGLGLLAQTQLALARGADAEASFGRLLRLDPHAPVPTGAPKVQQAFLRAREAVFPRPGVSLRATTSPEGPVVVSVVDPHGLVARVQHAAGRSPEAMTTTRVPVVAHAVTVPRPQPEQLVWVDAFDASNTLLAHLEVVGPAPSAPGPSAALTLERPSPSPRKPTAWLGWALVATAVAAAASAAVLFARAFQPVPPVTDAFAADRLDARRRTEAGVGWALLAGAGLGAVGAGLVFSWD
ncbi:MAG: hypothetical protein SFW67_04915 [Myxococcaceae bacterium]|nr:hypothetical protein [Myxococcaceae bacterium]